MRNFLILCVFPLIFMGCGNDSSTTSLTDEGDKKKPNGKLQLDKSFKISDLAKGGYVIYLRHTERDKGAELPELITDIDNRQECMPGTELNTLGREQAKGLAEKMAEFNIKVDQVYASPTCRTREQAEIMFGDDFELRRELVYTQMRRKHEHDSLNVFLSALLYSPVREGYNRVLIAHGTVLKPVGVDHPKIAQGDAIILKQVGRRDFEAVAIIPFTEWDLPFSENR